MSVSSNAAPVFLSYAREDIDAARRIADTLRASGIVVWFDENELRGGDAWDAQIRKQVKDCALFVPIISAATQARLEGYFRVEWKLAAQRTHAMAEAKPFLLPVVIDDTRDVDAHVPTEFRAVQWTRLPRGGEAGAGFCARLKQLVDASAGRSATVSGEHYQSDRATATPLERQQRSGMLVASAVVLIAGLGALVAWQPWRTSRPYPEATLAKASSAPLTKTDRLVVQARALYEPWDFASPEDFQLADRLLREATDADPVNAETWAALAILSYGLDTFGYESNDARTQLLRTSAERAHRLAPDSDQAKLALALWYRQPGTQVNALQLLEELAKRRPDDKFILREIAGAFRGKGQLKEALAWYARAADLPGGDPIARQKRGATLQRLGRLDEAEAEFEQALRDRPDYAQAHIGLLQILLFERGDMERVKVAVRRIPARAMNDERVALTAAYLWFLGREPERAADALRRITRDYVEAIPWRLPKSYLAGHIHRLAGRPEAAAAEWRLCLDVIMRRLVAHPTDATDLYYKAELHTLLGEPPAAEAARKIFEQLEAQRPTGNVLTWQIYAELDREEQVADIFAKWLKRGSSDYFMLVSPYAALFRYHPLLDRYRERPRFRELAAEVDRLFSGNQVRTPPAATLSSAPDPKSKAPL